MISLILKFSLWILVIVVGCKSNSSMNGVYVCDQSQKKHDSTIIHGDSKGTRMDLTCTIQELNFKGNSTVELKIENGPIVTSYVVDKDYVRVKGTGADFLFKIKDNKTLTGEGIISGIYHKR